MTESIIATYDNVKFIEGVTRMTQDNWQSYFSPVIQNGVYSGLEFQQYGSVVNATFRITDGIAYVNGIRAELHTSEGYTDIGEWFESGDEDAFFCLRVYFDQEKAEIIKKTDIIDEVAVTVWGDFYKYTYTLGYFLQDESYQCERNFTYYEIPLMYFGKSANFLRYGRDLRRMVKIDGKKEIDPRTPCLYVNQYNLLRSNNIYTVDTTEKSFYIDVVNLPDNAMIVAGNSGATVKLYKEHFINDYYCTNNSSYPYSDYKTAYDSAYGIRRHTLNFKSGITHSSGSDSTNFLNTYESVTLAANQVLHISYIGNESMSDRGYTYKFFVE